MPYIKVSIDAMDIIRGYLDNASDSVDDVERDFSKLAKKLDMDVRNSGDIQRRLNNICAELKVYDEALRDYVSFIDDAIKKYKKAEKADDKLKDKYLKAIDKGIIAFEESTMTEAEKMAQREGVANAWRVGITIAAIVGSIALGAVVPFGVPFVLISAAIGAVSSAAYNITDQYAEDGLVDGIDAASLGKDVVIGSLSSAVGCLASPLVGKAGSGIKTIAFKSTTISTAAKAINGNTAGRIIGKAVTGSISEISEGIYKRGVTTAIETQDLGQGFDAAFDGGDIMSDMMTGAFVGGGSEAIRTRRQYELDTQTSEFNKKAVSVDDASVKSSGKAGPLNVGEGKNASADFRDTKLILRNEGGEQASFQLKMTGDKNADELAVQDMLKKNGYGENIKLGTGGSHRLHYLSDLDANTGICTVQVVEKSSELSKFTRARGAVMTAQGQYRSNFGTGYGLDGKPNVDLTKVVDNTAKGINTASDMINKRLNKE